MSWFINDNFSDIAILNIKGSNYRCIISLLSKNETINLLQNADLTEKSWALSIKKENQPLCIFLAKMTAYKKDFDQTKYVSFLVKDDKSLEQ